MVLVNDLGVLEGVGVGAVVVEVVVVYLHYVAPAAGLPHATGSQGVGWDVGGCSYQTLLSSYSGHPAIGSWPPHPGRVDSRAH